ncbi:MAG: hypothetical protein K2F64_04975 [Muribaculaceae bacterium]|nr:hypothetical protein [Muribaculaceae bacterium]
MNKILLIAAVIFSAFSFASCSDDAPTQLIWEFSNYDNKKITAVYTPDYVNQVQVVASPDYTGEITLKCTNYTSLSFKSNNADGSFKCVSTGCTVTKVNDNTLKISFTPIEDVGAEGIYDTFIVDGISGKNMNSTNISVGRICNEKQN